MPQGWFTRLPMFFFRLFPPFLYRAVPPQAEFNFARFLSLFHRATDLLDDRVEEPPLGLGGPFGVYLVKLIEYLAQLSPVNLLIH